MLFFAKMVGGGGEGAGGRKSDPIRQEGSHDRARGLGFFFLCGV